MKTEDRRQIVAQSLKHILLYELHHPISRAVSSMLHSYQCFKIYIIMASGTLEIKTDVVQLKVIIIFYLSIRLLPTQPSSLSSAIHFFSANA